MIHRLKLCIIVAGIGGLALSGHSACAQQPSPADLARSAPIALRIGPARQLLQPNALGMRFAPDQHMAVVQQPDRSYRVWLAAAFGCRAGAPCQHLGGTGILATRDFIQYEPVGGVAGQARSVFEPSCRSPNGPKTAVLACADNWDADYAGANLVFPSVNGRDLMMIYHGETRHFATPHEGLVFYAMAGLARSTDGGFTWTREGPILSGPDPKPPASPKSPANGVVEPGAIVVGDFIYAYYGYNATAGAPDQGPSRIEVARAPLASDGKPGAWTKYYNGAFGVEPGLAGRGASLLPAGGSCFSPTQPWVARSTYLDAYVLVFLCRDGWYFSTSADLVTWAVPTQFHAAPAPLFRKGEPADENVILVTPGNPGQVIGETGYVLYSNTPSWGGGPPHMLWMREFAFSK